VLARVPSVAGLHMLLAPDQPDFPVAVCFRKQDRFVTGIRKKLMQWDTGCAQVLIASVQDDALNYEGEGMRRSVFFALRASP
jgi:hypothetical protein